MRDDSERSDDRFKYTEGRQAAGSQMGHGENTRTHTHTHSPSTRPDTVTYLFAENS